MQVENLLMKGMSQCPQSLRPEIVSVESEISPCTTPVRLEMNMVSEFLCGTAGFCARFDRAGACHFCCLWMFFC